MLQDRTISEPPFLDKKKKIPFNQTFSPFPPALGILKSGNIWLVSIIIKQLTFIEHSLCLRHCANKF